jgi:fused signal recognition particle receptor
MEEILSQIVLYLNEINSLLPQEWWYVILCLLIILLGLKISRRKRQARKVKPSPAASTESEAEVKTPLTRTTVVDRPGEPARTDLPSTSADATSPEPAPATDDTLIGEPQEQQSAYPHEQTKKEALEIVPPPEDEAPAEVDADAQTPKSADDTADVTTESGPAADPGLSPADLDQIAPDVAEELAESVEPISREAVAEPKPINLFGRLKNGLSKTRKVMTRNIEGLFTGKGPLDDDLLEELEELLITSDIGVQTTMDIVEKISAKANDIVDAATLKAALKKEIEALMSAQVTEAVSLRIKTVPHVIMVVGVNGVGKTTTIGKLAAHYHDDGHSVLIAAADTFRAAAVEQVSVWADRAKAEIVKHREGADPAAVAFDGVEAAVARKKDIVLIDTAGRLHTRVNLMEELKKIKRAIAKKLPGAPHEILLVLDATTGQNALSQAKLFNEALEVTGIALTKLDGTAKGGIVVSICSTLQIPLKHIGVGESIEDLQRFEPVAFTDALF